MLVTHLGDNVQDTGRNKDKAVGSRGQKPEEGCIGPAKLVAQEGICLVTEAEAKATNNLKDCWGKKHIAKKTEKSRRGWTLESEVNDISSSCWRKWRLGEATCHSQGNSYLSDRQDSHQSECNSG